MNALAAALCFVADLDGLAEPFRDRALHDFDDATDIALHGGGIASNSDHGG